MLEEKLQIKKYCTLSFEEFEKRYNSRTLGKLYLPNGACTYEGTIDAVKFDLMHDDPHHLRIDLNSLFDVMTGKNTGYFDISSDEFLGLIVYGDSIKFPGYKVLKNNNRGFLSSILHHNNSEEKLLPLRPSYAKFLVIVRDKIMRETSEGGECFATIHAHTNSNTEKILLDGKIKLTYMPLEDVKISLRNIDSDVVKIFERGIPLINGSGIFSNLYSNYSIDQTNPRKMEWKENEKKVLNCYVKS